MNFNHKEHGGFPVPCEDQLFGRWVKIKNQTLNILLSMVTFINYTLVGVSIHPVTTKIQATFLTQFTGEEAKRSWISL
jgi:hypothetical protein